MNSTDYKVRREQLGYTQSELAELLGVARLTIIRRESGGTVNREAELALLALPKKRKTREPAQ